MKKSYIFLIGLLFAVHGMAQTKKTQASSEFFDLGYAQQIKVSPNGNFVGLNNGIWSYATKTFTDLGDCEVLDVNDNGQAAGRTVDLGLNLIVAGVNQTGQWIGLGMGHFTPGTIGEEVEPTTVAGLSNDGKKVLGTTSAPNSTFYPFVWTQSADGLTWDTLTYKTPDNCSGKILSASADGSVASGWLDVDWVRKAVLWTSATEYKIFGNGEAVSVSPNGKYVAVSGEEELLYNIETGVLTPIQTTKKGFIVPVAVSDNGIVVGYRQIGMMEARIGFVWSEVIGFHDLGDFITEFAPDLTLPTYVDFNGPEMKRFEVPTTISGDGATIGGWAVTDSESGINGFVIRLSEPITQLNRAQSLKANVSNRNELLLTWDAPQAMEGETLTGEYNVYRNGEFVTTVTGTSYSELNLSAGYIFYTVSALYNGGKSASQTEQVVAIIVDNYDLPFADNFNSASFETNYWDVDLNGLGRFSFVSDFWGDREGFSGACVSYVNQTVEVAEKLKTLTSKILDATLISDVNTSFLIRKADITTDGGVDTLYVEVNSEVATDNWQIVDKITLDEPSTGWDVKSYDLSSQVAGKLFKIRFRGGNSTSYVLVDIDNFVVSTGDKGPDAPKTIIAEKDNDTVNLVWQDPSGSYGLTYYKSSPSFSIGNEGVPFIAANRFEASDLEVYKNLHLTSISAYINKQNDNPEVETKLALAVYVDGARVVNQDIESFTPNAWNTFKLNEAILISADKKIEFGIEVKKHDAYEYPLMTDQSEGIAGVSDLFTEDVNDASGVLWQNLANWGYPFNWSIIANVREAVAADGIERIDGVSGYDLYRGGEKINSSLLPGQSYQDDITGLSAGDICYTVVAYYEFKGYSEESESVCISNLSITNDLADKVFLYFDKVSGELRINGEYLSAMVFDLNGQKVADTSRSQLNVAHLNDGVYVVRIVCVDNSIVSKKVIVSK